MSLLRTAVISVSPSLPRAAAPTRRIGDIDIAAVTGAEAFRILSRALEAPGLLRLAFANAHCVNVARGDAEYRAALRSFLILPDGIGVDLASRLLYGSPFAENLNGTDFVPNLLRSIDRPLRVALVGGEPGIVAAAAERFADLIPGHVYLPVSHGYFADGPETEAVLLSLRLARADVVLVARGVPAQEFFIARHLTDEHARLAIGVGALLDFVAGKVPRAPRLVLRLRLEWVYRLMLEPRRLARRYILGNPTFLLAVLRQTVGRALKDR